MLEDSIAIQVGGGASDPCKLSPEAASQSSCLCASSAQVSMAAEVSMADGPRSTTCQEAPQGTPGAAETLLRLMRTGDIPSTWKKECERDAPSLML